MTGCTSGTSDFHIRDLAKTDIDDVSEIHRDQTVSLLKKLTEKLYKKNPYELSKSGNHTIETRISQIFTCPVRGSFDEIKNESGTNAVLLAFDPEYHGDRVFSLMFGLYTMIDTAYSGKCEFFILDALNGQNLYNCARNIEILVWRLNNRLKEDGQPYILTNSLDDGNPNLSYERLFGKLISLQDSMARIIAHRTGRVIKEVVQITGMAFLPIGI